MTVPIIQAFATNLKNAEIFQQMGKFAGHYWIHIQNFPTYAQDSRVAYSSLIIVSFSCFQIAKLATRCFQYFFPLTEERSEANQTAIDVASMLIGYGIAIGGVTLFVTKSQLSLSPYLVVALSVSTMAVCILLQNFMK